MYEILLVIFLVVSIALLALIMLQQSKSAVMGCSFRAGTSNTLFGSSGSTNFMTRTTAILAILFFSISLMIDDINSNKARKKNEWKNLSSPEQTNLTQPAISAELAGDIPKQIH